MERLAKLGGKLLFADTPDTRPCWASRRRAAASSLSLATSPPRRRPAVALVGGRNASANGRRVAEELAASLAERGLAIVSGLARGVDGAAHRARSPRPNHRGIAGGLDVPYPPEHADLQRQIAEAGAVVAEAPLGTAPQARHFPRRNRIIAGLALGVVVVEAAPRSGSLITARLAHDYGRELFAVPGSPLDPRCRGSNDLIRQGAHLTETAEDVLGNLPDHPGREGLLRAPLFARGPAPAPVPPSGESAIAGGPEQLGEARDEIAGLLGPWPTALTISYGAASSLRPRSKRPCSNSNSPVGWRCCRATGWRYSPPEQQDRPHREECKTSSLSNRPPRLRQ